jgi:hypothetical protein
VGHRAIKVRGKAFLWIEESYRAVAPKKLVASLDGTPEKPKTRTKRR